MYIGECTCMYIGEPNNLHESNEDCVVLRTDKGLWRHEKDTEWQDYPCCHSTGIKAVLCQFNQTPDDSLGTMSELIVYSVLYIRNESSYFVT